MNVSMFCSYSELSDIVDHLFPPCQQHCSDDKTYHGSCLPGASDYSSFNYWRNPLPNVDDEIADIITARDASAIDKNSTDTKKPQTSGRKAASPPPAPAT